MTQHELEKKYSSLLLDEEFIGLELLYHKPNIFVALKLANHEIRHSNFLGWLLDPKQTHGLGNKFLKLVLSDILLDKRSDTSVTEIGNLNLDQAEVLREWKNIDLLINIEGLVIVIENKIWAQESSHQLQKYKNTIDTKFNHSNKVFVFLTPYGSVSTLKDHYVNYSYERIIWLLELIVKTYAESISRPVVIYIKDYIQILKQNFMGNSDINQLAKRIYLNHRELFDFVFSNTPNPLNDLNRYVSKKILELGYVKKVSERTFVRFIPKSLINVIPTNGTAWKREALLFEIKIENNSLAFFFTIGPGHSATRSLLETTLESMDKDMESNSSSDYICFSWFKATLDSPELVSSDFAFLDVHFAEFWAKVNERVDKAENLLLNQRETISRVSQMNTEII